MDDFYTRSRGFKVYLSWEVPNCADGCADIFLNDGVCDRVCNVSSCGFDMGDCSRHEGVELQERTNDGDDEENAGIEPLWQCHAVERN